MSARYRKSGFPGNSRAHEKPMSRLFGQLVRLGPSGQWSGRQSHCGRHCDMRTSLGTGIALGFAASLALAGCSEPISTDGSPTPDPQSSSNASLLYEVGTLANFVKATTPANGTTRKSSPTVTLGSAPSTVLTAR